MVNPSACRLLAQMPSKAALRLSPSTSSLARSMPPPRTYSSYRTTGSSAHSRLPYLSSFQNHQNALSAQGIRQFGTTTTRMVSSCCGSPEGRVLGTRPADNGCME